MPNIQIDDDVLQELQNRAIRSGRMHWSANDVLRTILRLDTGSSSTSLAAGAAPRDGIGANQRLTRTRRRRTADGGKLLQEHIGDDTIKENVRRGYYQAKGQNFAKSFVESQVYPVALFDPNGYVIINSAKDIQKSPSIEIGANLNVRRGISNLPGYVHCDHIHSQ